MPVQCHLSLVSGLNPQRVQVDSPWYDERNLDQDFHSALMSGLDLLLPSEADLQTWRPLAGPVNTAAALARQASRPVLVKLGGQGAVLLPGMAPPCCAGRRSPSWSQT